jgi:hypothetical protein
MSSHGRLGRDESISDINKKTKISSKFTRGIDRTPNIPLSSKLVRSNFTGLSHFPIFCNIMDSARKPVSLSGKTGFLFNV